MIFLTFFFLISAWFLKTLYSSKCRKSDCQISNQFCIYLCVFLYILWSAYIMLLWKKNMGRRFLTKSAFAWQSRTFVCLSWYDSYSNEKKKEVMIGFWRCKIPSHIHLISMCVFVFTLRFSPFNIIFTDSGDYIYHATC